MDEEKIKKIVRESYGRVAKGENSCCPSSVATCCSSSKLSRKISSGIGYSIEEMDMVPEGSNLGLGCGNPVALASLKEGEVVLDLGSGAGFDCFLAANKVGKNGKVIGVDMTPDMIEKARENALKGNYSNVEFRLGEIENLPVADGIIDIIVSNCVINLAPDKQRVFKESFRVLKPGGRLMVSDIVLTGNLPEAVKNSVAAYAGCMAGAVLKEDYITDIKSAGFTDVKVLEENIFPIKYIASDSTVLAFKNDLNLSEDEIEDLSRTILSIKVAALKE